MSAPLAAYPLLTFALTLSILSLSSFIEASHNGTGGFRVELIHRDSPNSPSYHPSQTPFDPINRAVQRSIARTDHLLNLASAAAATNSPPAQVFNLMGDYLLRISIGTPPVEILGIADTGSELIWTQCAPCVHCYKQNRALFDPRRSSSYRKVQCRSPTCQFMQATCPPNGKSACHYSASYGDGSSTSGVLSFDAVTVGSVSRPQTVFGCGKDNAGTFDENMSGVIGLGVGRYSIISQMDTDIGGKFSYCLLPTYESLKNSSTLYFGGGAAVSGPGTVSTPLLLTPPNPFYSVTLEAISVGNKRIGLGSGSGSTSAGIKMIVDSGTTLTQLPPDIYRRLESAVTKEINVPRAEDPNKFIKLCYRTRTDIAEPIITVHFTGADVKLSPMNTFIRIGDDIVCFTFVPSQIGTIYGNLAQMNFQVGYDIKKKTVSFKPASCAQI